MKGKARKITTLILSAIMLITIGVALIFMTTPKKTFGYQNNGYVYVSDMGTSSKSIQYYDNIAINMGYPSGSPSSWTNGTISLLVGGTRTNFAKGIVLQGPGGNTEVSNAVYDITGMGATKFTAKAGVNSNGGTVVFVVKVDDVAQYTSSTLNYNSNAVDIDVTIPSGATKLTLEISNGGDGNANDHGAFADAKLYCTYADLSDVTPITATCGYGAIAYNAGVNLPHLITQPDGTFVTKPYFEKTIAAHANSTLEYDIDGVNAKRFTTMFGIKGSTTGGNGVVFKVAIDGVEKGSSTVLPQGQFGYFNIEIPTDAKKITLTATDNGNMDYDHAVWVNPRIYNYERSVVAGLNIATDKHLAEVNETIGTEVEFLDHFGINLDSSSYSYTLESSDASIVQVNADKKSAKALKSGSVILTAKSTVSGVQHTATKEIIVIGENNAIMLKSPNAKSEIQIIHSSVTGKLYYRIFQDGDTAVELSELGTSTSIGDFSSGLEFGSLSAIKEVNDTYQTFGGKKDYYTDHCFTQSMTLYKNGVEFVVETRAYDDGAAFRFKVKPQNQNEYTLFRVDSNYKETTTLSVPADSMTWSTPMPETSGKCSPHEQFGLESEITHLGMIVVPFMYKTPNGTYVYVMEAGMNGQYAGVVLRSIDNTNLRFSVSNQQQDDITLTGEFTSSWRTFATGTLQMVYATEIIENVSDPCKIEDTSWIEPGVASWSWMEGVNNFWSVGGTTNSTVSKKFVCPYCLDTFTSSAASATEQKCSTCSTKCYFCNHVYTGSETHCPNCHTQRYTTYINEWSFDTQQGLQADPDVIKKYIDLSASMGWEYFCMDDGWQSYIYLSEAKAKGYSVKLNEWANFPYYYDGFYSWTQEVCDYAESKGVGLIAWIHTGIMDTEEKMDRLFSQLQAFGIKGIKVDFFDSEEQWIIELWQTIYRKAAEYKLLVNVHGANKPTGERRTWPNVINREAIYGEEMNNTVSSNMVIQAVLRSICGPSDFTPYFKPVDSSDICMSGQIALPIIYESGIQCFASKASDYSSLTTEMRFYYTDFPEAWDESIFLSGEIGSNVSIARKGRDVERWYVGGLTVAARTDYIDCSFLDSDRNYTAYIYYGGDKSSTLQYRSETVTSASTLSVSVNANGGYAILFAPEGYASGYTINSSYALTEAKYKLNKYIGVAEGLNQNVYALTSYSAFVPTLNSAKTLASNGSATEVQLDTMSLTLKQAIDKIEKSADSSELKSALASAKQITSSGYTSSSFNALQTIITSIESLNLDRLTALEVSTQSANLANAVNDLEALYTISVTNDNAKGTVSGAPSGNVDDGTILSNIVITAKTGYKIKSVKWNGVDEVISNSKTITVAPKTISSNSTLVVEYESLNFNVTLVNDSDKGSITGVTNNSAHQEGSIVSNIVITAKTGYDIASITVNGAPISVSNANSVTFNQMIMMDTVIAVTYEAEKYLASISANNATVVGLENGRQYDYGYSCVVGVSANAGYKITSVKLNGVDVTITDDRAVTFNVTVTEAVMIEVSTAVIEITPNTFKVTVTNDSAKGSINGVVDGQYYAKDASLNITVIANDGYVIKSVTWGTESIAVINKNGITFTKLVSQDVRLVIEYEEVNNATPDTPSVDNGNVDNESKGCGSSVMVSYVGIIALLVAGVCLSVKKFNKKEDYFHSR